MMTWTVNHERIIFPEVHWYLYLYAHADLKTHKHKVTETFLKSFQGTF